jgi:hypothetical protein
MQKSGWINPKRFSFPCVSVFRVPNSSKTQSLGQSFFGTAQTSMSVMAIFCQLTGPSQFPNKPALTQLQRHALCAANYFA